MKNLKNARKNSNMTQETVAKILGIPKTTYANYEQKEDSMPPVKIIIELAKLFECSTDFLLGKTNFPEEPTHIKGIAARPASGYDQPKFTKEDIKVLEQLLQKLKNQDNDEI